MVLGLQERVSAHMETFYKPFLLIPYWSTQVTWSSPNSENGEILSIDSNGKVAAHIHEGEEVATSIINKIICDY